MKSHSGFRLLRVVVLQQAVGGVALEGSLQRMAQKFGHAIVQLDGRTTQ